MIMTALHSGVLDGELVYRDDSAMTRVYLLKVIPHGDGRPCLTSHTLLTAR
jgi:hypothetical protein